MSYLGDFDWSDYETCSEYESECISIEIEELKIEEVKWKPDLVIIDEDVEWVIDIIWSVGQELEIIEI